MSINVGRQPVDCVGWPEQAVYGTMPQGDLSTFAPDICWFDEDDHGALAPAPIAEITTLNVFRPVSYWSSPAEDGEYSGTAKAELLDVDENVLVRISQTGGGSSASGEDPEDDSGTAYCDTIVIEKVASTVVDFNAQMITPVGGGDAKLTFNDYIMFIGGTSISGSEVVVPGFNSRIIPI